MPQLAIAGSGIDANRKRRVGLLVKNILAGTDRRNPPPALGREVVPAWNRA